LRLKLPAADRANPSPCGLQSISSGNPPTFSLEQLFEAHQPLPATAAAALGLRLAQSPNAAYGAAMLGIVLICTFIASLLILALGKA